MIFAEQLLWSVKIYKNQIRDKVYKFVYLLTRSSISSILVTSSFFGLMIPSLNNEDSALAIVSAQAEDEVISQDFSIEHTRSIKQYTLAEKYQAAAGKYYYSNVEAYLPIIDKVLTENGLENDNRFIKVMFFVGQHESHWNTQSNNANLYFGLFQFHKSTFKSVGGTNIYDAEDQIRAFVTMAERGRLREFGTIYIKTLDPSLKVYALSYN